ncbi:hypothetical protein [Limosilactobacillus pontis]|uniref:hypothetical protein n=1 Tax=Limosilactobacillus pontis TaxID=35787 RepID=UPI00070C0550|nr:hypothetical protein [Limosilactobacillus pontis]QFV01307.1 hypothetical protein LP475_06160 [Limosilactobacillus pontis]
MKKILKNTVVGIAALTTSVFLTACGQQAASSQSSRSSSSTPSTESESSRAYHSAEHLIRQGNYKAASTKLNSVNHRSQQVNNLNTDLHNYMNAKKSYNNGDYEGANNNLVPLKSKSSAMRGAYSDLQSKISNAKKISSSSSAVVSSSTTSSSSSSMATSQSTTASQTSTSVINNFANKMGFSSRGYEITPTAKNGNSYRLEVRQSNQDNTVANMVGIYQYNSQTGTATKVQ